MAKELFCDLRATESLVTMAQLYWASTSCYSKLRGSGLPLGYIHEVEKFPVDLYRLSTKVSRAYPVNVLGLLGQQDAPHLLGIASNGGEEAKNNRWTSESAKPLAFCVIPSFIVVVPLLIW